MVGYLGVQSSDHLNWFAHIDLIQIKILKGLSMPKICEKFLPIKFHLSIYFAY